MTNNYSGNSNQKNVNNKENVNIIEFRKKQLQAELQVQVIKPISFEIFKKTQKEKDDVKFEKKLWKISNRKK